MTAAIFGLLGVLVGGVLSSAGDAWLDRRRQLLEGLAAARLVGSEMHGLDVEIRAMTGFRTRGANELSTPVWHEHRTALAGLLASKDWRLISGAYGMVALAEEVRRSGNEELRDSSVATLSQIASSLADTREMLASVGEGSRLSQPQKVMLRLSGGWPG
jgi:hypothetical protein